ncbi:Uncharacterized protein Fot_50566 [Forsythia ovata]|uniref:NB-ARC domain-containing protein n=1 Tax=Forsythia ovata TaxID=205694 RepID=A0ABD1PYH9_9LAMI
MAAIYSEFLLDKFVNEFQEAEKEKKFKPQKLTDLKDDLHEINDALVEHIGLAEDRRGNGKASATRTGKDLWIRYKTRRRLRSIRDKLQKIAPADLLADEEDTITSEVLVIKKDNLINIDLSEYHGLDDQKVKIENLLCESVGNKAIGIVGMGGTGKSALAQKVIFSSRVEQLFELILWIDLSKAMGSEKKYECISVTKDDVEKINCELNLSGLLTETFLEPQKKCLVVLDGVWHAIDGFDTLIEGILDGPIKGSVIVTSRLLQVVKKLLPEEKNYFYLHTMQPLSREDCWCIFEDSIERKYFIHSKDEILLEMKDEILDNCEGLPLAVKTLAEIISIQIWKQSSINYLQLSTQEIWLRVDVHDHHTLTMIRDYISKSIGPVNAFGDNSILHTRMDPFILWKECGHFYFTEITSINEEQDGSDIFGPDYERVYLSVLETVANGMRKLKQNQKLGE